MIWSNEWFIDRKLHLLRPVRVVNFSCAAKIQNMDISVTERYDLRVVVNEINDEFQKIVRRSLHVNGYTLFPKFKTIAFPISKFHHTYWPRPKSSLPRDISDLTDTASGWRILFRYGLCWQSRNYNLRIQQQQHTLNVCVYALEEIFLEANIPPPLTVLYNEKCWRNTGPNWKSIQYVRNIRHD